MPFEPVTIDHSVAMTPAEIGTKVAAIAEAHNPAPPLAPETPADARRRLDILIGDKDFGRRLLSGNVEAKQEFDRLQKLAASADIPLPSEQLFHTTVDGQLPPRDVAAFAAGARELGFGDKAIGEILAGKTFSAEEVFIAQNWKARAMRDPEFTKAWLEGNPDAARKMLVANAIITAGIEDAAT
jgi:hypothetical protein